MPQLKAAQKALRKNARQRIVNDRWKNKVRQTIQAVQHAITANDQTGAEAAFKNAQQILDKAAQHHIIQRNKVARKKAQLQKKVAGLNK